MVRTSGPGSDRFSLPVGPTVFAFNRSWSPSNRYLLVTDMGLRGALFFVYEGAPVWNASPSAEHLNISKNIEP